MIEFLKLMDEKMDISCCSSLYMFFKYVCLASRSCCSRVQDHVRTPTMTTLRHWTEQELEILFLFSTIVNSASSFDIVAEGQETHTWSLLVGICRCGL